MSLARDEKLAIASLRKSGYSNIQISDLLNIPYKQVESFVSSDHFEIFIKEVDDRFSGSFIENIKETKTRIAVSAQANAEKAFDVIVKMMTDPNQPPSVRYNCAMRVLELSGMVDTTTKEISIPKKQLLELLEGIDDERKEEVWTLWWTSYIVCLLFLF